MTSTSLSFSGSLFCAGLALALGAATHLSGATTVPPAPAPAATSAPAAPKAVFAMELPSGRDPFFPETQRLKRTTAGPTNAAARVLGVLDHLTLKGIALGKKQRLALISNLTLAEGEKAQVKCNGQPFSIQCLEIRERSVLVTVLETKETKELHLRKEI